MGKYAVDVYKITFFKHIDGNPLCDSKGNVIEFELNHGDSEGITSNEDLDWVNEEDIKEVKE